MKIDAHWMRGGTSKCWVFEKSEILATGHSADAVLSRTFGSPDPRQLDGVGGATSTTSKALILQQDNGHDIDVRFTFAQVGIDEAKVDWGSNCGNCSSAVGLYALEQGWVPMVDPVTEIRTFNTNTGQTIVQTIHTPGGKLPAEPDGYIPGLQTPGHRVSLGFLSPEGRTTGHVLPAGKPLTVMPLDDGRKINVSIVDAGAPAVIVDAESFGLDFLNYDSWPSIVENQLEILELIRRKSAVEMGLAASPEEAERAIPKLGLVSKPNSSDIDIQVLMLSMGKLHPAMPITGSVAVTVASQIPGTVVANSLQNTLAEELRIGIPGGVLSTFTDESSLGKTVGVYRTARTLVDGRIHLSNGELEKTARRMGKGALV